MRIKLTSKLSVQRASAKLAGIGAVGVLAGIIAGHFVNWELAVLIGWDLAAITFITTTWPRILGFDAELVARHATREDTSRVSSDVILLLASVASLIAVGLLIISHKTSGISQAGDAGMSVVSVLASWLLVHTVFALRYAQLYYTKPHGGVDFGDTKNPTYDDFAYLAFTVGMTYQVCDTMLTKRKFRAAALRQALLSFVFGTIIIAATINLVAGLSK